MGIHEYEKKYSSRIEKLKQQKDISEKNKKYILDLLNDLVLDGISIPRRMKYMEIMRIYARKLKKDFDEVTKEDLKEIVGEIQTNTEFSPWTKQTYKVILRRFYAWMHGMKGTNKYPDIVDWISIRMNKSECRLPGDGDLLSQEDVEKLISCASHPRDKAMIALLWDSGARIGEIGNLTLNRIKFDKHGIVITASGKTGSRPVRLIWSVAYLSTWLDCHPFKNENKAPLWVNIGTRNHGRVMYYPGIKKIIKNTAIKANITKRIHPHLFRHSRATFMADHLTEFQMNQYFGWIQGSKMAATYVHMNGKNLNDAILAVNGITKPEEKTQKLERRICIRCDTINGHDTQYCKKSGGVLDLKIAIERDSEIKQERELRSNADKLMDMLLKDKDVKDMLMEKLGENPLINLT